MTSWRAILLAVLSCYLVACASSNPYIATALEHVDQAITNGERKDNNALAEQATVALRYVYMAEKHNNKDPRLQAVIRELKAAIEHARYGRSEAGVQAAETAAGLLAEME